jgi:hypothetical protein
MILRSSVQMVAAVATVALCAAVAGWAAQATKVDVTGYVDIHGAVGCGDGHAYRHIQTGA